MSDLPRNGVGNRNKFQEGDFVDVSPSEKRTEDDAKSDCYGDGKNDMAEGDGLS